MNIRAILGLVLAAASLAGCTASMATDPSQLSAAIPGYSPTPSDTVGTLLMANDLKPQVFQANVCTVADAADTKYVLAISASGAGLAMDTANTTQIITVKDNPGKSGDLVDPKTLLSAADIRQGTNTVETKTVHTDDTSIHVTRCSLRVITAAVNLCVHRTASRNMLDKLENYGIDQVIGLAGAAAGIAALSHANTSQTTLAVAGAAGVAALATGVQKAVPTSTTAQVSPIISAGLQYLAIADDGHSADPVRLGLLFDAAFSACPLNT